MPKRVWKHKTNVFKEAGEWWWVCQRSDCVEGVYEAFTTALCQGLNHTFVGGYDLK